MGITCQGQPLAPQGTGWGEGGDPQIGLLGGPRGVTSLGRVAFAGSTGVGLGGSPPQSQFSAALIYQVHESTRW